MKTMIDPTLLKRYLAGDATDEEIQQCESYLSDPANSDELVDDFPPSDFASGPGDSLIETLQNVGQQTERFVADGSDSTELIGNIESMVPGAAIGQDELNRVLGPARSGEEIGWIGQYRVIEFIAGGGMGLVFRAEDPELQRPVCIKVLHPMLASNFDAKTRFAREAKAAAQLRSTRIVTVLDVGEHRELPFFVMQLLDGQSLRQKLNSEKKFPPCEAKKLTIQIAEGLRYAHGLGLLHRDIKPENIWVTTEGDIKLLDFGLARAVDETTNLTNTGTILGTPSYMSPEQVQGKELDERSDLFSVGSVMFEMLTGESPFGKSNLFSTMMSVANDSLELPDADSGNAIPVQLVPVIESLLKKSSEERTSSADDLIEMLQNADESSSVKPVTNSNLSGGGLSRVWTGLLGGLAGAACLAIAFFVYQLNDKGTLVVEADPSVSVKISDEEVSIHDPQTGKSFKVAIGDHPLPSGVYQLELEDESGQYKLSSNVIAIRRGEKQIVRVELKPVKTNLAETVADPNKDTADQAAPLPQKPKLTLAKLPTLDANDLRRKLGLEPDAPLLRNATVAKPPKREGVTAWGIEATFAPYSKTALNADGTMLAAFDEYECLVRIWNREGELLHMIPAQDVVQQVRWSPEANILAIMESGTDKRQVSIWKLFDEHFEAIDIITTDASQLAWSWDGLRLALASPAPILRSGDTAPSDSRDKGILFYDLSKRRMFTQPNFGIAGAISDHPWSSDGRYFTSIVGKEVKVWDLVERRLLHVFSNSSEGRFLPDSNEIAIKIGKGWEVWDLKSFERTMKFQPDEKWLRSWPDHQFKHIAAFTESQELLITNMRTGKAARKKISLENQVKKTSVRNAEFHWAENGKSFSGKVWKRYFHSASIVAETEEDLAQYKMLSPICRAPVSIGMASRLRAFDLSKSGNRIAYFNGQNRVPGRVVGFEFSTLKDLSRSGFAFNDALADYQISPDGKLIAVVGSTVELQGQAEMTAEEREALNDQFANQLKVIRVFSFDTGRLIKTIDAKNEIHEFLWSPDSNSLCFSSLHLISEDDADDKSSKRYYEPKFKIVSLKSDFEREISPAAIAAESTSVEYCFQRGYSFRTWSFAKPVITESGMLAIPLFDSASYRGSSRVGIYRAGKEVPRPGDKLGLFNPRTGELVEAIDLKVEIVQSPHAEQSKFAISKNMILIDRKGGRAPKPSMIDSCFVLDRKNNNKSYVPELAGRYAQIRKTYLSPAHPYFVSKANLSGNSRYKKDIQIWKLDSKRESLDPVKRFTLPEDKDVEFVWHATKPIVAWAGKQTVNIYNAENDKLTQHEFPSNVLKISSLGDGWLVAGTSRVVGYDSEMNVRKSYLPSAQAKADGSFGQLDQCVTAGGKILNESNKSNLRAIRLKGNRFETMKIEDFESQK